MEYKIEQIGGLFSSRDITNLAKKFTNYSEKGYKFHSVFPIAKEGCLGIGAPKITYLAVYVKDEVQVVANISTV